MNEHQNQFPYLQESTREKYYILKFEGDTDFSGDLIERWCDLKDADWLREDWRHDLNWRPKWEMQMMFATEATVSKLLLEDRVYPRTSNELEPR